jgi:hypothetical protein
MLLGQALLPAPSNVLPHILFSKNFPYSLDYLENYYKLVPTMNNTRDIRLTLLRKVDRAMKQISDILTSDEYCILELLEDIKEYFGDIDRHLTHIETRLGLYLLPDSDMDECAK